MALLFCFKALQVFHYSPDIYTSDLRIKLGPSKKHQIDCIPFFLTLVILLL